ncbi:sulfotransferase family protein [Nitrosococcus wardiae]|uniref:Sulfotransferase family protein n=1 Tax=Nitrosococcus wardiae TaxID=1814290 RepID=A0A4P7BYJ9_9GAMM|nr:sulfotransferase family protein [Nitrosococcus wardiae]QBQ53552.1 sulfotransferase family protein [Nitrosococcus wardiae]
MKVIAILGMHRSGTSCLTGMLENAGLHLGAVSRRNPYNKKGNNEHPRIMALHEAVLATNQGSWKVPPRGGCCWDGEHLMELRGLLEEHSHLETWGFKDPRTLFTLEGWLEVVPEIQFIGSFRHPAAVARSLVARGGGPLSQHLELWWLYNRRLIHFQDRFGFDLVCFDDSPEVYVERVVEAARNLGLNPTRSALTFFDRGLRTHRGREDLPLPGHVENVYQELLSRSLPCWDSSASR